jgi:hypothetical protein
VRIPNGFGRSSAAILAAFSTIAPPARAADPAPVFVHDSRERSPLASVQGGAPAVYARTAGGWRQYWLYFRENLQDRGIVRTGRHAGDWELVQVRREGTEAVYSQHAGGERCGREDLEWRGGRPVVYLANGSHAAYFHAGTRDRTWPDPNDEADGRGRVVRPRVVEVTASSPSWMRRRAPWGGARAGWVPGEQDSPRGPAFQPQGRWSDPAGWAARAAPCTGRRCVRVGACDGRETAMEAALLFPAAFVGVGMWRRRRRRRRR